MKSKSITPDLKSIAGGHGTIIPAELNVQWVESIDGKSALMMRPTRKEFNVEHEWVVVINDIEFKNGEIEFDARGQSDPPQSNFLGVSFRYVDETTHDAVYFRPFNFCADDADRKAHAVQYISHPKYRWFTLRENKSGQYEKPIIPAPDGDAWFHAKIVIESPLVSVYVNAAMEPSLVVNELSERAGGKIGFWIGPGQGGYFANLKITHSTQDG
jgi:hypothetical protein